MPWEARYLSRIANGVDADFLKVRGSSGCYDIGIHPNGEYGAYYHTNGSVAFFDLKTKAILRTLELREDLEQDAHFDQDLTTLTTTRITPTSVVAEVWDLDTGQVRSACSFQAVGNLSCDSYGRWIVVKRPIVDSSTLLNVNHIYDVKDQRWMQLPELDGETLRAVLFDPEKTFAITCSVPNGGEMISYVRRYSLPTWELQTEKTVDDVLLHAQLIPEAGELILAMSNRTIKTLSLLDISTKSQARPVEFEITALAVSPDESMIALGSQSGVVEEFERESMRSVAKHFRPNFGVTSLQYEPDGSRLWGSGIESAVFAWPSGSDLISTRIQGPGDGVNAVAFSPDGSKLAAGFYGSGTRLINVEHSEEQLVLEPSSAEKNEHSRGAIWLDFTSTGNEVITVTWDGYIRHWNVETGDFVKVLYTSNCRDVIDAARSPDHRFLIVANRRILFLWDLVNEELVDEVTVPFDIRAIDIAKTGNQILVCGFQYEHNPLQGHIDPDRAKLVLSGEQAMFDFGGIVTAVRFSPNGENIAIGEVFNRTALFAAQPIEQNWMRFNSLGAVKAIAFSQDGTRMVSASSGGRAIVWEPSSGQEIIRLKGHHGTISTVAFSPDDSVLATGGVDGDIRLWKSK